MKLAIVRQRIRSVLRTPKILPLGHIASVPEYPRSLPLPGLACERLDPVAFGATQLTTVALTIDPKLPANPNR
jgi:hypothetical protein